MKGSNAYEVFQMNMTNISLAKPSIAMLVPQINPGSQGFRYRCLYPSQELRRRNWPLQISTPSELSDAKVLVVMSDVCLESASEATLALKRIGDAKRSGARVVVTETDNRFYNPREDPELARKAHCVKQLFKLADEIVVTTESLGQALLAERITDAPITVIPDGLETEEMLLPSSMLARLMSYRHWSPRLELLRLGTALHKLDRAGSTPIVWFGGHGTGRGEAGGMLDLLKIRELLEHMHQTSPISLTVISNNPSKFDKHIRPWAIPTFYLTWDRLTFHQALRFHRICVLPIQLSPWTVCKSGNRLLTALHTGLACVADEIQSYSALRGVCQLGNWEQSLTNYLNSPKERARDVVAASELISQSFTFAKIADQWEVVLSRSTRSPPTLNLGARG